ncbi:hypothetical protein HJA93_16035 [Rhizobium binae]|nr:hypothetical protein [Rhizobium binae]
MIDGAAGVGVMFHDWGQDKNSSKSCAKIALSARSWDFGQVEERLVNVSVLPEF